MKASCSTFSQILKLIPRIEFEKLVKDTGAERAAKGLSSWRLLSVCSLMPSRSLPPRASVHSQPT